MELAISMKADKNLKEVVIQTLKGFPVGTTVMEYRAKDREEMARRRSCVLMYLMAELYKENWEALKTDFPKAVILEESYGNFTRHEQQVCLSLLLLGAVHFLDGDFSKMAGFIDSLETDDFQGLPFW